VRPNASVTASIAAGLAHQDLGAAVEITARPWSEPRTSGASWVTTVNRPCLFRAAFAILNRKRAPSPSRSSIHASSTTTSRTHRPRPRAGRWPGPRVPSGGEAPGRSSSPRWWWVGGVDVAPDGVQGEQGPHRADLVGRCRNDHTVSRARPRRPSCAVRNRGRCGAGEVVGPLTRSAKVPFDPGVQPGRERRPGRITGLRRCGGRHAGEGGGQVRQGGGWAVPGGRVEGDPGGPVVAVIALSRTARSVGSGADRA